MISTMPENEHEEKYARAEIAQKVRAYLEERGYPETAAHCHKVAVKARELALTFGESPNAAEAAGWLHDISASIRWNQRVQVAQQYGLDILPEERIFPMLLHQKISAEIARFDFGIEEETILSAIRCHTTLKAGARGLDRIVFVADKIEWDQPGSPPYLDKMLAALNDSLEAAALVYIDHLWTQRDSLPGPLHPWLIAAREELHQNGHTSTG